jgi:hypothetical protein
VRAFLAGACTAGCTAHRAYSRNSFDLFGACIFFIGKSPVFDAQQRKKKLTLKRLQAF